MDPVVKRYDELANDYDRRWRDYTCATLDALVPWLALVGNERLLDVPCGTGALAQRLQVGWASVEVVGVDASAAMLEHARAKHEGKPYRWLQADVHDLPLEDESFDVVVCVNSFHCFDRPADVLAEFGRVLRPGGRLLILDWCDDYLFCKLCGFWLHWFDPAFRRVFTSQECARLIRDARFVVHRRRRFRRGLIWGLMVFEATKPVTSTL